MLMYLSERLSLFYISKALESATIIRARQLKALTSPTNYSSRGSHDQHAHVIDGRTFKREDNAFPEYLT